MTDMIIDDELDDDDDFLGDDDWEDTATYASLLENLPQGWHLCKISNYTYQTLLDIREWCAENIEHEYGEVNWSSGCSYSTAMKFADTIDAAMFKLRWGA